MTLAFFDLDLTILAVNSATLWVRRERREGRIKRSTLVEAAFWLGAYHLGLSRVERGVLKAISTLKGADEKDLERRTGLFWEEECLGRVRPGAREALRKHKEQGDRCVLLTSSSIYLSRLACTELGIPEARCTTFELQDGIFTGRANLPLCFGEGKLVHAQASAEQAGESLSQAWFYTDSLTDLPVLEAVGHPVCVHPDPRLAREARRREWEIVTW